MLGKSASLVDPVFEKCEPLHDDKGLFRSPSLMLPVSIIKDNRMQRASLAALHTFIPLQGYHPHLIEEAHGAQRD